MKKLNTVMRELEPWEGQILMNMTMAENLPGPCNRAHRPRSDDSGHVRMGLRVEYPVDFTDLGF